MYFYNARFYDPALGRFISPDTIVPGAGNPQAWDRYAYGFNNPIRYNDPSGHCPAVILCAAGVLLVGAIVAVGALTFFGVVPDQFGIEYAHRYVDKTDAVTAAGIAVQSQWLRPDDAVHFSSTSGLGIAQVSDEQMGVYAKYDPSLAGADQVNPNVGVKAMAARIGMAVDACKQCANGTDRLIVAALAQNGSEFNPSAFKSLPKDLNGGIDWNFYLNRYGRNPSSPTAQLRQWVTGMNYGTEYMLKLYSQNLEVLMAQGYELPDQYKDANLDYINNLIK